MRSNRIDLDNSANNSSYLILTLILFILSTVGLFLLKNIQINQTIASPTENISKSQPTPTSKPILSEPKPTPMFKTYVSVNDKFTAIHTPSRKIYQDREITGNRYIFYLSKGNITVHVGNDWSWVYPNRQFSQSLLVSGYPTFIYDIDNQTIVDFQVGNQKYTIQCVHNSDPSFKTECQQFLVDFKIN